MNYCQWTEGLPAGIRDLGWDGALGISTEPSSDPIKVEYTAAALKALRDVIAASTDKTLDLHAIFQKNHVKPFFGIKRFWLMAVPDHKTFAGCSAVLIRSKALFAAELLSV